MSGEFTVTLGAGAPLRAAALSHDAASLTDPALSRWVPASGSADADLLPELEILRSRSRHQAANEPLAGHAVQAQVDNVVGPGLRLSAQPEYRALGRDKAWAREWAAGVESLWRTWAESTECDAAGTLNFAGLTEQMFRAVLVNGEGLCLLLWQPERGGGFATRLQTVESDRLSNPHGQPDTARLRGGVEIDAWGAPVAYHIERTHPGDVHLGFAWPGAREWERVPAATPWGRRRVIHLAGRERCGMSRGKPLATAVMPLFKMLGHYLRTELKSTIVNSLVAGIIESNLPPTEVLELFGGSAENYLEARNAYRARLEGGSLLQLPVGDQLKPFIPGRPTAAFGAFCEYLLRIIAAGLHMPYELLLMDFSKTNYSSARAALLEAWRYYLGRRRWLADYWAGQVYLAWLEEAVDAGLVEAPGFYGNRLAYARARWIGPGRGWIDPLKEAQAAQLRLESGLSTLEDELAEQGRDLEETLDQREAEREMMRDRGLLAAAEASARRPVVVEPDPEEESSGAGEEES